MAGIIGGIRDTFGNIRDSITIEEFDRNTYAFISLNNGTGSKTLATNVALELSKKYKVCILDSDFPQPGVGILLNTPITLDLSILNYFNSSKEVKDMIHPVKGKENLWIVSTSPIDHPQTMANTREELMTELVGYLKSTFDYLIISMNYNPFAEWFIQTLNFVDRGYFVWDEQIDNVIKTKAAIDYVHQISHKANSINNIIINKRTNYTYPYNKIKEIECNLVAELPFTYILTKAKNEGKLYDERLDKRYHKELEVIIADIESGQDMQKGGK